MHSPPGPQSECCLHSSHLKLRRSQCEAALGQSSSARHRTRGLHDAPRQCSPSSQSASTAQTLATPPSPAAPPPSGAPANEPPWPEAPATDDPPPASSGIPAEVPADAPVPAPALLPPPPPRLPGAGSEPQPPRLPPNTRLATPDQRSPFKNPACLPTSRRLARPIIASKLAS